MEEESAGEADAVREEDKKWKLVPYDTAEWTDWVTEQRAFGNLGSNINCYIQVRLKFSLWCHSQVEWVGGGFELACKFTSSRK